MTQIIRCLYSFWAEFPLQIWPTSQVRLLKNEHPEGLSLIAQQLSLCAPSARAQPLWTWSHMLWLKVLHAQTKTRWNQINKLNLFKRKKDNEGPEHHQEHLVWCICVIMVEGWTRYLLVILPQEFSFLLK